MLSSATPATQSAAAPTVAMRGAPATVACCTGAVVELAVSSAPASVEVGVGAESESGMRTLGGVSGFGLWGMGDESGVAGTEWKERRDRGRGKLTRQ